MFVLPERVKATTMLKWLNIAPLSTSSPVVTFCEGGGLMQGSSSALAKNGKYFRNTISCHKMNMVIHKNAFSRSNVDVYKFKRQFLH